MTLLALITYREEILAGKSYSENDSTNKLINIVSSAAMHLQSSILHFTANTVLS